MNGNSMSPENKMRGNNGPLWSKRGRTASSTDRESRKTIPAEEQKD
jgi:hypothetical protein